MLFGTIVFMSRTFRGQWTSVFLVFVLKLHVAFNLQNPHDNEPFDKDFGNFLRDLGSQVYKSKRPEVTQNEVLSSNITFSTLPIKNYRRSQKFNTQKAILEDVLMMKLVSYYEDKYKLSHLEQSATEGIIPNADISKTEALTKNNVYKYNVIDKDEIFNNNPIQTKQKPFGSNRRMMNDMSGGMDDYQVSDVVIF